MKSFFQPVNPNLRVSGHLAIDIIVYVASLASSPRSIDPILDGLRRVTARLRPGESPSPADIAELKLVYRRLEGYMVSQEPIRSFTVDQLRSKVMRKFRIPSGLYEFWERATQTPDPHLGPQQLSPETVKQIEHVRRLGRWIIGGSVLMGLASFFLPAVPSPAQPLSNNFDLMFSLTADLLMIGSVWLFIRGLNGFSRRLKRVYWLLCAAIVLVAAAQSQQVIYTFFGLWTTVPFIQRGGVGLGFVPTVVLYYAAMLMYARLSNLKNWSSSWRLMLLVSVGVALLALVVPVPTSLPPGVLPWILPPSLVMAVVLTFAAFIALSIKRVSSQAYTPALAWLVVALGSGAFIGLFYGVVQTALPLGNPVLMYGAASLLFIGTGISFVRSAVAFNMITED